MFPANIHDSKTVDRTLDSIPLKLNIDGRMVTRIAADKAYNSKPLAERMNVRKINHSGYLRWQDKHLFL